MIGPFTDLMTFSHVTRLDVMSLQLVNASASLVILVLLLRGKNVLLLEVAD